MVYPTNNEDTRADGESVSIDPSLGEFITYRASELPNTLRTKKHTGGCVC